MRTAEVYAWDLRVCVSECAVAHRLAGVGQRLLPAYMQTGHEPSAEMMATRYFVSVFGASLEHVPTDGAGGIISRHGCRRIRCLMPLQCWPRRRFYDMDGCWSYGRFSCRPWAGGVCVLVVRAKDLPAKRLVTRGGRAGREALELTSSVWKSPQQG